MPAITRRTSSVAAALLLGWLAACRELPMPLPSAGAPPVPVKPTGAPADLGERAYAHVARLVSFGARHPGSAGWQQGLDHIAAELRRYGLEPVRDRWTDERHKITFENIHARLPGTGPDRIVIGCHHDTKCCEGHDDDDHNFEFVGANDSGSGVGLVLALAESLAAGPRRRATIHFAFFDGEESLPFDWDITRALFGSKRFVARQAPNPFATDRPAIRAMLLLDMVGAKDLQIDDETNSTPELKEIIRAAAVATGHQRLFFRERMAISDDHLPFLDAGIPAIDLIDLIDNPQWHTPDDTLEHISARSMQIVGEVVWAALPAIEARYFGDGRAPRMPRRR